MKDHKNFLVNASLRTVYCATMLYAAATLYNVADFEISKRSAVPIKNTVEYEEVSDRKPKLSREEEIEEFVKSFSHNLLIFNLTKSDRNPMYKDKYLIDALMIKKNEQTYSILMGIANEDLNNQDLSYAQTKAAKALVRIYGAKPFEYFIKRVQKGDTRPETRRLIAELVNNGASTVGYEILLSDLFADELLDGDLTCNKMAYASALRRVSPINAVVVADKIMYMGIYNDECKMPIINELVLKDDSF